jgi:inorganic phosphate transporter, PiT family
MVAVCAWRAQHRSGGRRTVVEGGREAVDAVGEATGHWTDTSDILLWVQAVCALAIAAGTYLGGWRIIRTLGKGLVEISPPQGMAAESASAAVILTSSQLGFALSTTHVATGSILRTARPEGGRARPGRR